MKTLDRAPVSYARFAAALIEIRDPDLRDKLITTVIDAVGRLNEGKAQRIVLAARRMSCLYALMIEHGLEVKQPERVVSDRFIDLLPDGIWSGERVLLLDDTRVTGRTMRARKASVERLVGDPNLVEPIVAVELASFSKLHDVDALDLHTQFARCFGTNLLPFFTDFVVSDELGADAATISAMLTHHEWLTVDVTNSVIAGTGARAFSLFPNDGFLESFLARVGVSARLIEVAKIRLFVDTDNNDGSARLRIVPIVLTSGLAPDVIYTWLEKVGIRRNSSTTQAEQGAGLIAILLSRALMAAFSEQLAETFGLRPVEDGRLSSLALGDEITRVAERTVLASLGDLAAEGTADAHSTEPVFDWPVDIATRIADYVLVGDDLERRPYRRLELLKEDADAFVSMSDLAREMSTTIDTASVAIDVLNDLGYCVPVFRADATGLVRRCYRPGESVRPYGQLPIGRFGGRLASVRETTAIADTLAPGDVSAVRGA